MNTSGTRFAEVKSGVEEKETGHCLFSSLLLMRCPGLLNKDLIQFGLS